MTKKCHLFHFTIMNRFILGVYLDHSVYKSKSSELFINSTKNITEGLKNISNKRLQFLKWMALISDSDVIKNKNKTGQIYSSLKIVLFYFALRGYTIREKYVIIVYLIKLHFNLI